jgi:hypothetical protein
MYIGATISSDHDAVGRLIAFIVPPLYTPSIGYGMQAVWFDIHGGQTVTVRPLPLHGVHRVQFSQVKNSFTPAHARLDVHASPCPTPAHYAHFKHFKRKRFYPFCAHITVHIGNLMSTHHPRARVHTPTPTHTIHHQTIFVSSYLALFLSLSLSLVSCASSRSLFTISVVSNTHT